MSSYDFWSLIEQAAYMLVLVGGVIGFIVWDRRRK